MNLNGDNTLYMYKRVALSSRPSKYTENDKHKGVEL